MCLAGKPDLRDLLLKMVSCDVQFLFFNIFCMKQSITFLEHVMKQMGSKHSPHELCYKWCIQKTLRFKN